MKVRRRIMSEELHAISRIKQSSEIEASVKTVRSIFPVQFSRRKREWRNLMSRFIFLSE